MLEFCRLPASKRRGRVKLSELKAVIETGFAGVHQQFAEVHLRFAEVDRRFTEVDKRFAALEERLARFEVHTDERFAQIDERFAEVDERFDQMDARFIQMRSDNVALAEATRRHFDIMAEKSRADVALARGDVWTFRSARPTHVTDGWRRRRRSWPAARNRGLKFET